MIEIVDEELGRTKGESLALISYVEDRAGHDLRYAIDSTRLQQELGWHAEMPFDKGLRQTVQWYLNNKEWVEKSLKR